MCVSHVHAGAHRGQKRAPGLLGLEFQGLRAALWYWEPNPGLLATGGNALNPRASCPALNFFLKEIVHCYKAKPQIITTVILILVHASLLEHK